MPRPGHRDGRRAARREPPLAAPGLARRGGSGWRPATGAEDRTYRPRQHERPSGEHRPWPRAQAGQPADQTTGSGRGEANSS